MFPKIKAHISAFLLMIVALSDGALALTLREALEIARTGNRDLALATARVEEQEAAWRATRAERWPSLDFAQRVTRIDDSTVARANSAATGLSQLIGFEIPPFVFQDSFRTELGLELPLWTSGALRAAIGGQREGLAARHADREAAWRQTRGRVARFFFAARASREVAVARRQSLARAERRLAEAERRLEVGLTTRQEVLRWQVEVERARAQLAAAEADGFVADLELADVLGLTLSELGEPEAPGRDVVETLLPWAEELDPRRTLARADAELDELPEVRAARAEAAASGEAVRGARAERLPRVDAAATYGWLENETLGLDGFENWSASLLLTMPLDLRGRLKAGVARSRARREEAATAVDEARALRRLELGRTLAEIMRVTSRLRSARRAEQEAAARRALLERQTEIGLTGLLDLIDADTTLAEAEFAHATARVDLLAAVAALELAWPGADPPGGGLIP